MNTVIWPFTSQTDKKYRRHRLDTCGACKQFSFVADRIRDEFGWPIRVVLPYNAVGAAFLGHAAVYNETPVDNPIQRIHWDTKRIREILEDAQLLITNHEYLPIPARVMFPKLKIVCLYGVVPDSAMFDVAFQSTDIIVAHSDYARKVFHRRAYKRCSTWPFAYDEQVFAGREEPTERDIDVLFVQRCSATNYTHHEEFLEAMKYMKDLRVAFTDVTGYLRQQRPELFVLYSTPETYIDTLYRSKVAVAMCHNLHGGQAVKEAARAGCSLVVSNDPCYDDLYDAYRTSLDPAHIAATVRTALKEPRKVDVSKDSYQAAWPLIRSDLQGLRAVHFSSKAEQEGARAKV